LHALTHRLDVDQRCVASLEQITQSSQQQHSPTQPPTHLDDGSDVMAAEQPGLVCQDGVEWQQVTQLSREVVCAPEPVGVASQLQEGVGVDLHQVLTLVPRCRLCAGGEERGREVEGRERKTESAQPQ